MKKLFYSDILRKTFENESDCVKAEAEYTKAKQEKEEKEKKLQTERKVDADAVTAAFNKYSEDYKEYIRLRNDFVKKYGSFHLSVKNTEELPVNIFEWFNII